MPRHFLTGAELSAAEVGALMDRALELKRAPLSSQALADLLTLREAYGSLRGLRLAYVGDGNNVARSLAVLGTLAGVDVAVASPEGYALDSDLPLAPEAAGSLSL